MKKVESLLEYVERKQAENSKTDAAYKKALEQTAGWAVAREFLGEPAFNQNAQCLAEKINAAIDDAIAKHGQE